MNNIEYEFTVTATGLSKARSIRQFGNAQDVIRYTKWLIRTGIVEGIEIHVASLQLTIIPEKSKGYETWLINL